MAWIESHQELGRHPKTKRLARVLGVPIVAAIGHLHFLWWWALEYADDGDLTNYEPVDIAEASLWEQESRHYIDALIECGFLDRVDNRLTIHDWHDYAGRIIQSRDANAERQKRYRQRRRDEALIKETRNDDVTVTATSRHTATVTPTVTVPEYERANESADSFGAPDGATGTLTEKLRCFQERLAAPNVNKVTVVGDAFHELTGWKTNYGRIGRILGKYDAPFEVIKLIVQIIPSWNGVDDPHDYLQKAVEAKRNGSRNGHANGRLHPIPSNPQPAEPVHNGDMEPLEAAVDDEELTAEDRAALREHERRLRFDVPYQVWWEEAEPYVTNGRAPPKPAPKARLTEARR